MEDAAIHNVKLEDENCIFAVFDGHGGIIDNIKDIKLANMSNLTSLKFWSP